MKFWWQKRRTVTLDIAGWQACVFDASGAVVRKSKVIETEESADYCMAQWIVADPKLLQCRRIVRPLFAVDLTA